MPNHQDSKMERGRAPPFWGENVEGACPPVFGRKGGRAPTPVLGRKWGRILSTSSFVEFGAFWGVFELEEVEHGQVFEAKFSFVHIPALFVLTTK